MTSDDVRFTIERDPRPEGQRRRPGARASRTSPRSRRPTRRPCASASPKPYAERILAFNLPIVSAAAFAQREEPRRNRSRSRSGAARTGSRRGSPTGSIRLYARGRERRRTRSFDEVVFRVIPDDSTRFQAGAARRARRVPASAAISGKAAEAIAGLHGAHPHPQGPAVRRGRCSLWNVPQRRSSRTRASAARWRTRGRGRTRRKRLYPPEGAALVVGAVSRRVCPRTPRTSRRPGSIPPRARACSTRPAGRPDAGRRPAQGREEGVDRAALSEAGPAIDDNLAEILRSAYEKVGVELDACARSTWAAVLRARDRPASSTAYLTGRLFLPPNFDPFPYFHSSQWRPERPEHRLLQERRGRPRHGGRARLELDPAKRHRALPAGAPHPRRRTRRRTSSGAPTSTGASPEARRGRRGLADSASSTSCPGPLGWRPAPAAGAVGRRERAARGRARPRPLAGARGPLLHDDARGPRRARRQGRAPRGRRRHARLGAAVRPALRACRRTTSRSTATRSRSRSTSRRRRAPSRCAGSRARADVLVENFPPGGLEKFGLSAASAARARTRGSSPPRSPGFGRAGPDALAPGFDLLAQAGAGLMAITGTPESAADEGRRRRFGPARRLLRGDRRSSRRSRRASARDGARTSRPTSSPRRSRSLINVAQSALLTGEEAAAPRQRAPADRSVPDVRRLGRRLRPRRRAPTGSSSGWPALVGRPEWAADERVPRPTPARVARPRGRSSASFPRIFARDTRASLGRALPRGRASPPGRCAGRSRRCARETARALEARGRGAGRRRSSPRRSGSTGAARRLEFPPALDADGERLRREFDLPG